MHTSWLFFPTECSVMEIENIKEVSHYLSPAKYAIISQGL